MSETKGKEKENVKGTVGEGLTPQDPPKKEQRRIVNYVMEQGPDKGKPVPCVIVESKMLDGDIEPHVMLNTVDSPETHYQSWVRFSTKKEPGTWHYA